MSSATSLLSQLQSLSIKLEQEDDVKIRNEAVQLSRQITAALSRPEDVAAEMIFTVRVLYYLH